MAFKLSYNTAAFRVCVDQAEDGHICGRIVSQRLKSPILFSDINNFISQLDAVMDVQMFPKAFQHIRTFAPGITHPAHEIPAALVSEEMMDAETVNASWGEQFTFLLYVNARQNACWQGFTDWLDGTPQQAFNSILEFIKVLDYRVFVK